MKCFFHKLQLEYLGHWISATGMETDGAKIESVKNWPESHTVRALRGFLGLAGYYRRFVAGYATLAWPFTQLLTKKGFHWSKEATVAFETLKRALSTAPVLALPDFTRFFELETDASKVGIGAVLMQQTQPIAYSSQALPPSKRNSSAYERDLLAIILSVRKWCHYLLFQPFIIRTDQHSLKYLLEQ